MLGTADTVPWHIPILHGSGAGFARMADGDTTAATETAPPSVDNTHERLYAMVFAEGGGTLNGLYAMARNSHHAAVAETRAVREALQIQTARIDASETLGQPMTTSATQMQMAIVEIMARLTNVETTLGSMETNDQTRIEIRQL